jgi:hypothetical protein
MPGAGGPPGCSCRCGHRGIRDGGTASGRVPGQAALRQRPAPVRCRAKGSGPGCRPPAASAPVPTRPPAAGRPLVPSPSLSGDPRSCSEPARAWPPGAPVGRALEDVLKVLTGKYVIGRSVKDQVELGNGLERPAAPRRWPRTAQNARQRPRRLGSAVRLRLMWDTVASLDVLQLATRPAPRCVTGMVVRPWRQTFPAGTPSARIRCGIRRPRPGRPCSARGGSVSRCCSGTRPASRHHLRCCGRRCRRLSRVA